VTLTALGYVKTIMMPGFGDGVQVSVTVHVDDLFFTCCKEDRIAELATSLRERYGEIKCVQGPVSNYLAMMFDTST
jgi:hypothetical protein